jgi:ubiquinone/menaquinone biosynthesis C-methylase UbiE
VVWHQDVIEHTGRPFLFLKEQYRVLRTGGAIIVGTPNLLRPANMIKACLGKLQFPIKIGEREEIGNYIHIQEFHEQQLQLVMQEIGFSEIRIRHLFFGLHMFNLCLQDYPTGNVGRTFTFLFCTARK